MTGNWRWIITIHITYYTIYHVYMYEGLFDFDLNKIKQYYNIQKSKDQFLNGAIFK